MQPDDIPLVANVLTELLSTEKRAAQGAMDACDLRLAHVHLNNINLLSDELAKLFGMKIHKLDPSTSGISPTLPTSTALLFTPLPTAPFDQPVPPKSKFH